jgi:hypothetical protein
MPRVVILNPPPSFFHLHSVISRFRPSIFHKQYILCWQILFSWERKILIWMCWACVCIGSVVKYSVITEWKKFKFVRYLYNGLSYHYYALYNYVRFFQTVCVSWSYFPLFPRLGLGRVGGAIPTSILQSEELTDGKRVSGHTANQNQTNPKEG